MPAKLTDFPDISELIYSEHNSMTSLRSRCIEELRKMNNMYASLYANKLEESSEMLKYDNLKDLEQLFLDFKEYIRICSLKYAIPITIKYRQKDYVRYHDKIRKHLVTGSPLDRIYDLFGFRLILGACLCDDEESVRNCYLFLEEVFNFFVIHKYAIPYEAETLTDTGFINANYPEIVVPKENLVPENFQDNVKDYIRYPKETGYQSLHVALRTPNGLTFEVQVRTFAMDIHAEIGKASHKKYEKDRKFESDIQLDYSKIHIPGFVYLPTGEMHDHIGLVRSIDPFNSLNF